MYVHKIKKEYRCPLEYGIEMFEGKWKTRIICLLNSESSLRYNEIREKLLDIEGIGGLGHLAIQYAKKLGFTTVAISHGSTKEQLIKELGADYFIDSSLTNPVD